MPTQVVTGIDIYPSNDPQHACASIRRVGGGMYRVVLTGEDIGPINERTRRRDWHEFPNEKAAIKWAMDIAKFVEADPTLTSAASVHQIALAGAAKAALEDAQELHDNEILAAQKRIATLEGKLAAKG